MDSNALWFLTMPYKEKLKNPSSKPRKKPSDKISNWIEYNNSLKKESLAYPRFILIITNKTNIIRKLLYNFFNILH